MTQSEGTIKFNLENFKTSPTLYGKKNKNIKIKSNFKNNQVLGCANISGKIDLVINSPPDQFNSSLVEIVKYECSTNEIQSNQISVVTNYQNGDCDSYSVIPFNNPTTLSVSLQPNVNSNCKKKTKKVGLIVGLSIGVPILVVIFILLLIFIFKKKNERSMKKFTKNAKENNMLDMKTYYVESEN